MKLLLVIALAVGLSLAGCTTPDESSDAPSGDRASGPRSNTGGGGSEVHGTVEVTNNSTSS